MWLFKQDIKDEGQWFLHVIQPKVLWPICYMYHVWCMCFCSPWSYHSFLSYSVEVLRARDAGNEKKDGSSPKGVIEASLEGLESDVASPEDSPKAEVRCTHAGALSNWRKLFKLWKRKSEKPFSTFPQLAVPRLSRKNNRSKQENPMLRELYNFKSSLENFSLSQLRAATENFNRGMQFQDL